MSFENKVVLITGASSGIGAGIALHLSTLKATLVLIGRNKLHLNEIVKKCTLTTENVPAPLEIIADVTTDAELIIKKTIEHFGRIDVLINNAGQGGLGSIETTTLEQYDDIMNTNVRAVYHLTMLAVPYLILTKGNIVNVSSVVSIRNFTNLLAYSVSKAALDQFTKCVALELADRGVRVNSVNPTVVVSNFQLNAGMSREAYEHFINVSATTIALGRVGQPIDVATAVAFLADEKSASFITGTLLPIDGGKALMCPR